MDEHELITSRRFRYGFVCFNKSSSPEIKSVNFWNRLEIDSFVILTHPETETRIIKGHTSTAVFIGDVFVCDGEQTIDELTLDLINNDAWDSLDKLSGRFALLILSEQDGKIINDPIGSRTIYYRERGDFCVGSHSALVAELFGDTRNEDTQKYMDCPEYVLRGTQYLPGDLTVFSNIYGLIPNNYLEIKTRQTKRFWPRKPLQPSELRSFNLSCDHYFQSLINFIREKYEPIIGLTGGVDSRLLIAVFKLNQLNFRTVTWGGHMITSQEFPIVKSIAKYLGSDPDIMDITNIDSSVNYNAFEELSEYNSGHIRSASYDRNVSIASAMGPGCKNREVFIRGSGGEILRGFYNLHNKIRNINQINPRHLSDLYYTKRISEPSPFFSEFTTRAFENFISRANYSDDFYYHDPQDLLYWEQRMGMWGANTLNALDAAVYSFAGMNSRILFENAFGLPPSTRKTKDLILNVISRYDQTLGKLGREIPKKEFVNIYQKSARSIKFIKPASVSDRRWNILVSPTHIEKLAILLSSFYGKKVLEIGSGSGILGASILKKKEINRYFSLDLLYEEANQAKDTISLNCENSHKAHFLQGDGYDACFPSNQFDTVLCCEVLEHVHEPQRIIDEISRVLKDRGNAIISVPIQGVIPPQIEKELVQDFSIDEIRNLLEKAGLKVFYQFQFYPWNFFFSIKTKRQADTPNAKREKSPSLGKKLQRIFNRIFNIK